ncbi:MAG: hypothetical protein COU40_03270 [Candidatus Moranbacteria bacterium CG10_big_fil_rev_8_21_14_0_10_35_21]|nr:MAG: hypothetical protein COU40_03270 [Candidatus Moranbacteria bacterium CG10_big_fil_rev_8_21_14_0_10_35_21]PJA88639.1 MAG: hypothetical protein CO139_01985 [Candidatus Moranbacteria bacterium CG_4_9_14_3_um_filter_36_9]
MSIQSGVGFSSDADAKKAGGDACQKAIEKLKAPKLIIVFSSVRYDQKELLDGVRSISKETPLIGCSDAGEITGEGPTKGGVAVMALKSDSIDFVIGKGGEVEGKTKEAGAALVRDIMSRAKDKVKCYIMLTDVLKGNGAEIVRGLQDVAGKDALIFGGAAGDDFKFKETFVYYNDTVLSSSLVGVGLVGDFSIGLGVRHGWIPIGAPKTVTKSHGAVVEEIDGKPAVSIYEEYFGKKDEDLRKEPLAIMAITYPLGMTVEGSTEFLIRDPISVDEKGAITCAAEMPEGATVRLMIGSKDEAIIAAKDAAQKALDQLQGKTPKAIILFNCIARSKLFGEHAKDEIDAIQSVLGKEVPLIGFYTYGEQAPIGGDPNTAFSCFHNETAVIVALGE